MTKREVKHPLISYRDPDGKQRHALQGTEVDVGTEWLDAFDKANGTEPKKAAPKKMAPQKSAPKKRGRPRKQ